MVYLCEKLPLTQTHNGEKLKDEETGLDVGKSNMSSFCSLTEEQKQVSHAMEVCVVVDESG